MGVGGGSCRPHKHARQNLIMKSTRFCQWNFNWAKTVITDDIVDQYEFPEHRDHGWRC